MKNRFVSLWKRVFLITVSLFLITAGSAFAAGFALVEQSASGLGNAFSGGGCQCS